MHSTFLNSGTRTISCTYRNYSNAENQQNIWNLVSIFCLLERNRLIFCELTLVCFFLIRRCDLLECSTRYDMPAGHIHTRIHSTASHIHSINLACFSVYSAVSSMYLSFTHAEFYTERSVADQDSVSDQSAFSAYFCHFDFHAKFNSVDSSSISQHSVQCIISLPFAISMLISVQCVFSECFIMAFMALFHYFFQCSIYAKYFRFLCSQCSQMNVKGVKWFMNNR